MRALEMVAPGTALREGIDNIVDARTGGLIVIGDADELSFLFSGGLKLEHRAMWKTFRDECRPYDGPPLAYLVTACKAPDGSYWALQSWQRGLPDYGVAPTGAQGAWELRLSHWTGDLPVLNIQTDWAWHQWDHLFGTFTYDGTGVYGFKSTPGGAPLDTFGRNLYLDAYNSDYGSGWVRVNSWLT